jgi:hypothetical protein
MLHHLNAGHSSAEAINHLDFSATFYIFFLSGVTRVICLDLL